MKKIPSGCILRRWTIWVKEQITFYELNIAHDEGNVLLGEKKN